MKKRFILLLLFLASFLQLLDAEIFKFIHAKGQKYRIISEVTYKIFINGEFQYYVNALNKIAVEILEEKNKAGYISGLFQISERVYGEEEGFVLAEELSSIFWRDAQGYYTINPHYFAPTFRNIPVFPKQDISPGFNWTAEAQELHDLRRIGITDPYLIPIDVHYTYLADIEMDGKKISQFKIEYAYEHEVKGIKPSEGQSYPIKIAGKVIDFYNWDNEAGEVHSYEDSFHVIYFYSNGNYVEYIGTSAGEVFDSPLMDREKVADDIKEDLKKENLEGVTVEHGEKGVTITLQNIQFQPDSDELLPQEKAKLQKIAEILKKYPERDILIEGHAAKLGTDEYLQKLSERRAKAVGDYLLSLGATKANKMIIIGKGATEPIASNKTEAERIKNRRVEITILEN
jgi:outer membrane protein OmpA-like peptidoglycan-associated protein